MTNSKPSLLKGPLERLFQRFSGGASEQRVIPSKEERWKEHEVHFPEDHDTDHDACWTAAPGVWYCRTCHEWFRTWRFNPQRPMRQEEGW